MAAMEMAWASLMDVHRRPAAEVRRICIYGGKGEDMALQLWMPLMGDLRNQGLSNFNITTLGTISWVTGKLGAKALKAGVETQTTNGLQLNSNLCDLLNGNYSISVWLKPYGTHVHYNGSVMSSGNWNTANKRWAFGVSQDNSKVDVLCMNYNTYISCPVPANEWTHIVCARGSDDIVKLYKNGEYIGEKNCASDPTFASDANVTCIGRETYAGGYFSFNGAIQDLRLYDHCLSEMEIKQLSQGLVLHYPLNRQGFGQENLITQAMIDADPWKSAIQGTYTVDGKTGWILSNNQLYSKSGNGANNIFSGLTYDANTQYTISFKWRDDYRTDGKSSSLYIRFKYSDGTYSQVISSKDYNYWKEEVLTSTAGKTVSAITTTYGNGGQLLFTDLKLEKGAIKTPFSPIVNSDLYNSMGLNGTIEYDTSGYCNNGTRTGTFTWTSDTPKYSVSQVFASGNNYIDCGPSQKVLPTDELTVSLWTNYSTWGNPISCTEGGGWNFENGSSGIRFPVYISSVGYKLAESNITPSTLANGWHMLTGTFDKTNVKIYIDGVLEATTATGSTNGIGYAANHCYVGAEASGSTYIANAVFVGKLSDVRIYATALSADDVKSLYQNCATIDPDGTIRGQIRS